MHAPNSSSTRRPSARAVQARAAAVTLALLAPVAFTPAARAVTETEVRVERVRPEVEKHPTLRFLHENAQEINVVRKYDHLPRLRFFS